MYAVKSEMHSAFRDASDPLTNRRQVMSRSWFGWLDISSLVLPILLVSVNVHAGEARLKVGPVYRAGMESKISGGSHVQSLGLTAARPQTAYGTQIGPQGLYSDRTYLDGYVNRDEGTGNPASLDPNTTWYWGYDNASQYSDTRRELSFHTTGRSETTREILRSTWDDKDSLDGWGLEVAGEFPITVWKDMDVGLVAGWKGFWSMKDDFHGSSYQERINIRQFALVDTYDVSRVMMMLAAPHRGTYDGPFDSPPVIPSPLIPNLPTSRREKTCCSRSYDAMNLIDMDTEADLYEFRVGPSLSTAFHGGRLRASLAPALTFNILDVEADRKEQWVVQDSQGSPEVLQRWEDHTSDTDVLFGIGLDASAEYLFNPQWAVSLSVSADWVESARMQVGPSRLKTDVSGFSVGLALVRTFGAPAPAVALEE